MGEKQCGETVRRKSGEPGSTNPGPWAVNSPEEMRAASSALRRLCSSRTGSGPPPPSPPDAEQRRSGMRRLARGARRSRPWPEPEYRNGGAAVEERLPAAVAMAAAPVAQQWLAQQGRERG
jgi:hypothetical protein